MTWTNVKLVLHREVRDQLRDRRTLFMIAVLPLLLYPLLGMSMFQVLQFVRVLPLARNPARLRNRPGNWSSKANAKPSFTFRPTSPNG